MFLLNLLKYNLAGFFKCSAQVHILNKTNLKTLTDMTSTWIPRKEIKLGINTFFREMCQNVVNIFPQKEWGSYSLVIKVHANNFAIQHINKGSSNPSLAMQGNMDK